MSRFGLQNAWLPVIVALTSLFAGGCSIEDLDQSGFNTCVTSFNFSETSGDEIALDSTTLRIAMPFVLTSASAPSKVSLKLLAAGSPTGNLAVEIQNNVSNHPENIAIETATLSASAVSAAESAYYSFVFSTPETLAIGTYWIVLKGLSVTGTDYVKWMGNDTSSYSGGSPKISTDGTNWISGGIQTGRYFLFKLGC